MSSVFHIEVQTRRNVRLAKSRESPPSPGSSLLMSLFVFSQCPCGSLCSHTDGGSSVIVKSGPLGALCSCTK